MNIPEDYIDIKICMNYNLSHFDRSYRSLIFLNTQYFYYFDLNKVDRLHSLVEKNSYILYLLLLLLLLLLLDYTIRVMYKHTSANRVN